MKSVQRWLTERALHSTDIESRVRAIDKLATSDDPHAVEMLLTALSDPDLHVRTAAAIALGEVGDDRAVDGLISLTLKEREISVREKAVASLANIDRKRATGLLLRALEDPDVNVRQAAAWALRRLAWDDLEPKEKARVAIVRTDWEEVTSFGSAAVEPLEAAFRAGTQRTRSDAAEALAQIGTPEAVQTLVSLLGDFELDTTVREIISRVMRRYFADDLTEPQQALICIALGEWSDVVRLGATAVPALVSALPYPSLSQEAARALIRIGPAGVDTLVAVVRSQQQPQIVREAAAIALAEIGDARAIDPLTLMLTDADMAVRHAAVWTLQRLGWQPTQEAQHALVAIAHDDWEEVRKLGVAAVEPLLRLVTDSMATLEVVSALALILETRGNELSLNQLRTIAALPAETPDDGGKTGDSGTGEGPTTGVSHARLRKLGRAQLFSRGLMS